MSKIPEILVHFISREIWKGQAMSIWSWLQSNSATVIVDELEAAVRKRRDWSEREEE